jgi:NAD(P)-dependent dehydrogenase (short-subunit alcohol dehydrogenase family)
MERARGRRALVGDASAAFHAAKHGQSGFSDRLRHELKEHGVAAIYPPDFDDVDPLEPGSPDARDPAAGRTLINREIVATVLFAITAPRPCAYPVIILDAMKQR